MRPKVELLAPAGNPESFYSAIHAGADAVYLGGNRFGARAYAENFTEEELIRCIRYAHIWNRRVYLTVNTLVKETEFEDLYPYLKPLYEAGLDGVIIQDIGVFCAVREWFPDLELHVSTQMTLTGSYGAAYLKKMGAVRIVPARELGLTEIMQIKHDADIEIEAFIHGAMCYCYSGQCLFSSMLGGRSGNRGRCAQPCRLPYRVDTGKHISGECFPLSLKDMCTIEHIPDLIEAGIDSFKIEGRMKKPEYAAGVTAIYRKYIDRYYAGGSREVSPEDMRALSALYIRSERQDGYYFRHNGRDMVTLDNPSYSSTPQELTEAIRREYIETVPHIPVKISFELKKGKPATLTWILADNEEERLTVEGETVAPALKQPVTEENIRRQLGKLGDTVFTAEAIDIDMEQDCFYPLKSLNELRRQAVERMENALIRRNQFQTARESAGIRQSRAQAPKCRETSVSALHVLVRTDEQLDSLLEICLEKQRNEHAAQNQSPRRIYLEAELAHRIYTGADAGAIRRRQNLCKFTDYLSGGAHPQIFIALPQIIRTDDRKFLGELGELFIKESALLDGVLVRSMDGMGFADELAKRWNAAGTGKKLSVCIDAGFYIWNSRSLEAVPVDGFCLPYELKAADQRRLLDGCRHRVTGRTISCEKVVYGYVPLMHTANCVLQTVSACGRDRGEDCCYLIDRLKKRFPVLRNCRQCMNIIYNSLPLSLHTEIPKWQGLTDFRIDFTIENKEQTKSILEYFMSGCHGEKPFGEHTTGHEKRGAE